MANFEGVSRTNYFGVKNKELFLTDLSKLSFGDMSVFEDIESKKIALGGYDNIVVSYDEDGEFVELYEIIQKHIKKGDACIILLAGHEKLKYVLGYAYVITTDEVKEIDLQAVALDCAAEMLGIDNFETKMDY